MIAQIVTTSTEHEEVILAIVAVLATSVAGLVYVVKINASSKVAADQSTKANEAVNNVGPGEHRLYDVIARIESKQDEFDRRWGNLPAGLDTAVGLAETLHTIIRRLDSIDAQLVAHVEWEERVKWPTITKETP